MGIVNNNNCHLLRINGMADHVHMLVDIHPTISVATFVKEVKQWSSNWLRSNANFPMFESWGVGYYAISIGVDGIDGCRNYIINQEIHHSAEDLLSEMLHMAMSNGINWHPDDWN